MWQELTLKDTKLITLYRDVMWKMDKFYLQYDVDRYEKNIRRGDRSFYYTDGKIDYFITLHWNPLLNAYKILFVGFQGTTDANAIADIGFEKLKEFIAQTNKSLYAERPNVMDDQYINLHHDRWITKPEMTSTVKATVTEVSVSASSISPTGR